MLRRLLVVLVQLYLTADYCDPSVPGVFFFEADSYFVDSTEARPAMPQVASPAVSGVLPVRDLVEPPMPRVSTASRAAAQIRRLPRSYVVASSPARPQSSEDH
ncbi:MAG TPA: hypothetical protein VJZ73_12705 [Methylomirabilota bacterium]|nr:hypothetical protein [Methylomirabilota bacterium]